MSRETQVAFKKACEDRGIWAGGKVATHQDLSAYFFARCVELYFLHTGVIAFVMPYAAMSRRQFEGFRKGVFGRHRGKSSERITFVRFVEGWAFSDDVQPLFPVPSCVLIGELRSIGGTAGVLPETVKAASGRLPRRDASKEEAEKSLTWREIPWPRISDEEGGSPYRDHFLNGATIFPRVLSVVEPVSVGPLGGNPAAPLVVSRRTKQEKRPWKDLPSLRMNVEREFVHTLYLGESVAPFRLLRPVLAVIPWDGTRNGLMDANAAQLSGRLHLGKWLAEAERLWAKHGRSGMTFVQQLDYYGKLSAQLPPRELRVLFGASGTLSASARLRDKRAIVEHGLYWIDAESDEEAWYLCGVLNSDTARLRVEYFRRGANGGRVTSTR
jgi:hypothetical protein